MLTIFVFSGIGLNGQQATSSTNRINGSPFIRNYTPDEYKSHNQNWAIIQDKSGIMYFGNSHGILEYDAVNWRLIHTPNQDIVRSLTKDNKGTIYYGGFGEIGYLAPDSANLLQTVSLLSYLDTAYHDFSDVWQTLTVQNNIFFVTAKYIFRWDGKRMHTWTAKTSFHVGFSINDKFYIRQKEIGLMEIIDDVLMLAPLGEKLADEKIMGMLPFIDGGKNKLLLATRTNGLLLYDQHSIIPFLSEATDLLKAGQVYCATKFAGEQFAIGTLQNGILIIDANGKLHHHLNKASGLQDETIWHLLTDRQGDLWTGMHVGISRVEMNTPFTQFTSLEGVEGSVLEIIRHQGTLYIATSMGIFYLDESENQLKVPGKFKKVSGVSPQAWALLSFGDILLGGTFDGLYEINGDQSTLVHSAYTMTLHQDTHDPNRLFIGMQDGFKSLYRTNNQWRDDGMVEGMDQEVLHFYQSPENKLWITTRYTGIYLADFSNGFTTKPVMLHYDTTQGLEINDRTIPFQTPSGLRFATLEGVYLFDEKQQQFLQDTNLISGVSHDQLDIFSVSTDKKGNLWMVRRQEPGIAWLQEDKSFKWESTSFKRIESIDEYYMYPDPDHESLTWIGCIDRVIQYDGKVPVADLPSFATQIRQVIINEDSLVFGGANASLHQAFSLDNRYRSLRIKYAALSFGEESKTQYQYILEGYDAQWSNWTTETYKDYTGLPQGNYRFLVRSKNIYQQEGEVATFEFKIFPPFYLTPFAFILYAFLLCGLIYLLWQLQMKRVRAKHQQQLEQVEYEKLKELDQLKSRFFADISHEFRTPLTLILGPVETLLSKKPPEEQSHQYHLIRRNAQRLLKLINQLLDLSKLEAGKMKLEMQHMDIIPLMKGIVHPFESLVESKNIELVFTTDIEHAVIHFDRDKIEQVLYNLISNAIKFSFTGGKVMVNVKLTEHNSFLQIEVTDTGAGIAEEQLHHVFDRFYQGSEASRIGEPGTGIGLALAKELVELHGGRIEVRSIEHQGTTFRILLPCSKEQRVDSSEEQKPVAPKITTDNFASDSTHSMTTMMNGQSSHLEYTVLLVEDNPDMRSYIRETLGRNYRILEATDGEDGIEKAIENIPDIIISDVMMPRKDGLELCGIVKRDERTSHIPIILLTAKAEIDSRLAGLERGADDYMAKPFNREELIIRTRNLLEQRKWLWNRYASLHPLSVDENKDVQIEDEFLKKIREILEDNLEETEFEIEELARMVGMSRSQLFRKIKALTGQSPSLYIRAFRLHKGKELLENTSMNVSEVAYQVGFSTPAYFSDAFTETYGFRPSQLKT